MKHTFNAKIYKTGINWCVDVPINITENMLADKGYITIKGQINDFDFTKTLVPVKNAPYRLFVNLKMMKGAKTELGKEATFEIEQDTEKKINEYPIPILLVKILQENNLTTAFENLTASRKKDILKYLSYVKTNETLVKNIEKLLLQLKNNEKNVRIP
jgi:Domain of unknown function (DUF1905)/Bacteriocin-protection, YdeI or OmpD-Associated